MCSSNAERTLVGAIGSRGTATIVFGLLADNRLPDDTGDLVLPTMVFTVALSILFHGMLTPLVLHRKLPAPGDRAHAAAGA